MLDPLLGRMAAWYQRSVGTELRKYGLRYEDLLDPQLDLVSHRSVAWHPANPDL